MRGTSGGPYLQVISFSDVANEAWRPPCMARHEPEVQRRVAVFLLSSVQAHVHDKSFRRR